MGHRIVDTIPVACVTTRTRTNATAQIAPLTVDMIANALKAAATTGQETTIVATDTQTAAPLGAARLTPSGTADLLETMPDNQMLRSIWAQAAVDIGIESTGTLALETKGIAPRSSLTRTADFYIGLAALDTKTPLRMLSTNPETFVIDVTFKPGRMLDAYGMPFNLDHELTLSIDAHALLKGLVIEVASLAPTKHEGHIGLVMARELLNMTAAELLRSALMMTHLEAQELDQLIDEIPREMCVGKNQPRQPQLAFLIDRNVRKRVPTIDAHLPDRDFTYVIVSQRNRQLCRTIIGRADYEATFKKLR